MKKVLKTLPDREGGEFLEMSRYDEEEEEDRELLEPLREMRWPVEYAWSGARDAVEAAGLV